MIAPLKESDIDLFVVLDPKYYSKYSPSGLLDRLRTILRATYPSTPKISRSGQAVTISFTDFEVDVVPGYNRRGGGYLIPDSISGTWLETDPTVHSTHVTTANTTHNRDLVPLIKMIKGWNRCINSAFIGFYLEFMVVRDLNDVRIDDFSSGVRYVFDKGRESINYKIADPAGFGDQISGLNNVSKVSDGVSRFQTAYNRAKNAEEYARAGRIALAFGEWRKIFPRYFPAYG